MISIYSMAMSQLNITTLRGLMWRSHFSNVNKNATTKMTCCDQLKNKVWIVTYCYLNNILLTMSLKHHCCLFTDNIYYWLIDWARFNVPPTHIGVIIRVKWPNQQCQSTEGRQDLRIRQQSHQVQVTVLTVIQQLCSMKQKHTKYTQINTNKSIYAQRNEPSVTKPNPENCKNCSSKCAYDNIY